jgi:thiamine pyrophosphate-dependent acetolactate synthase large subunit-like protein
VLLDNRSLGKIGKEQLAADCPVWHTSLLNPDCAAYAGLCGATGIRVDSREQLDASMGPPVHYRRARAAARRAGSRTPVEPRIHQNEHDMLAIITYVCAISAQQGALTDE